MTTNQRSLSNFEVLSRLGQGAFGQVFKVKRKSDDVIYALKKIKTTSMKQKDRVNALNQIRILASVTGDNIIGYKDSFYDDATNDLCIVLEYAAQGDITRKIKEHSKAKKFIDEVQIWKAMVDMAKGIRILHDSNILHRDLKSANVFIVEDGTYKLGDLNISKVLTKGLARTQTGTPYYCSPEVWKDIPYGPKSDIWSFGCILYEMAAQKPPFTASDIQGLYKKINTGVFSRIPNIYSNDLSDMINSMLNLNPDKRPSTHDILKSPIVQKHYPGNHFQMINRKSLLGTIQFNEYGWKNINDNLPRSKFLIQAVQNEKIQAQQKESKSEKQPKQEKQTKQQQNLAESVVKQQQLLKIPATARPNRPLSSKSDKKYCMDNNSQIDSNIEITGSKVGEINKNRQPSVQNKRQMILSAGKRINASVVVTPQKPKIAGGRKVLLPPIDSSKKQRRNSDKYQPLLMPPRPVKIQSKGQSQRANSKQNVRIRKV